MQKYEPPSDDELRRAFQEGLGQAESDSINPSQVPQRLRAQVLRKVRLESGVLLAKTVTAAAAALDRSLAELAAEARGYEGYASSLLRGEGDPRRLPPHVLAHLLFLAGIGPAVWTDLLVQAVASHAGWIRPIEGESLSDGTSRPESQQAGVSGRLERNPDWAHRVATSYVREVTEEWTRIAAGSNPRP
jgi:hypothetical protein